MLRFLVFVVVWVSGCALADFVLKIESTVWLMAWGFVVGTIAFEISDAVTGNKNA